jgi:anti-sigma-K factor RskA
MSENGHARWSEDVAAYLLGALDPEEMTEFERHLEGCERCRSEMRWLTAAVEALPEAVERQQPPPRVRERVMTEVRADARAAGVDPAAAEGGVRRRLAAWLGRGSGSLGWRPVAGIAALALVLVAFVGYEIGNVGGGTNTDTVVAGHAPGITAKVVRSGDNGELHLANVHQLPENRVLEAWLQRDGEVEPVKELFVPDGEGNASTTLGNIGEVEAVLVTTEPAGGSKAPTSTPIVNVPLSQ